MGLLDKPRGISRKRKLAKTYSTRKVTKNRDFISSFEFAWTGLVSAFKDERNMKKHMAVAALVLIFGFLFQLDYYEWLIIIICVFLVFIVEMLNTVAENIVDLVTDGHWYELAKVAKDVAAGAVLLTSLMAAIVGVIIFGRHFLMLIGWF
ncbi:MAG: diacylglycerol kinase family protein [Lactobacillales bacterium]|jgi:undecaprenol kinase|nr:diacylglycerol kinase family protein [Lactobacillales bacterium]